MSGRKTSVVSPPASCVRDAGKVFKLTEMDAVSFEKWEWRAGLALKGTTASVPYSAADLGPLGTVVLSINALLHADLEFSKIEPLLDDLLACVTRVRDPAHPDVATPLMPEDIQEPRTVTWLRAEVLSLHVNFSIVDVVSNWISEMQSAALKITQTSDPSPDK